MARHRGPIERVWYIGGDPSTGKPPTLHSIRVVKQTRTHVTVKPGVMPGERQTRIAIRRLPHWGFHVVPIDAFAAFNARVDHLEARARDQLKTVARWRRWARYPVLRMGEHRGAK